MKKLSVAIMLSAIFAISAFAQRGEVPSFGRYRVAVDARKPKPVDLNSNKRARLFRTNLREAARGKVNFAGHYIFTIWGCGTNCNDGGIIDTRTGKVYFPKELGGVGVGMGDWSDGIEPYEYKPDSKLFIINGLPGGSKLDYNSSAEGIHAYEWTGTSFRLVKFVKKSSKK